MSRKKPFTHTISQSHPHTLELLASCRGTNRDKNAAADLLAGFSTKEITGYSNEEVAALFREAGRQGCDRFLASFMNYVSHNEDDRSWDCSFIMNPEKNHKTVVSPYSPDTYLKFGTMLFQKASVETHQLVRKALDSYRLSLLWLDGVWHYIAAWRRGDIHSLPVIPALPVPQSTMRERLEKGDTAGWTVELAEALESEILSGHFLPNKTASRQHTSFLTVRIPDILKETVGTAYALCLVHCGGDSLTPVRFSVRDYEECFGEDYTSLFGKTVFENRRANKSFMDVLAAIVSSKDPSASRLKSYVTAGYARAHSMNGKELPAVTSVYLSKKMDGLTRDEVMAGLCRDGFCSFAVGMFLSAVYGAGFDALSFGNQSMILAVSGLDACRAESLCRQTEEDYHLSVRLLSSLHSSVSEKERQVLASAALDRVSRRTRGGAFHKDAFCRSSDSPCLFPEREHCFGCSGCSMTEALFYCAEEQLKKHFRMLESAENPASRMKEQMLIRQVFVPAAIWLLGFCRDTYGMDISRYKERLLAVLRDRR